MHTRSLVFAGQTPPQPPGPSRQSPRAQKLNPQFQQQFYETEEEDSVLIEETEDYTEHSSLFSEEPTRTGLIQRLRSFVPEDADGRKCLCLAIRVAVAVVIMIMPLAVKKDSYSFLDNMRERGLVAKGSAAMLIYTVYYSVGETTELAWSAVLGTALSVGNSLLITGVIWNTISTTAELHAFKFWFTVFDSTAFILLVLALNLSMNTRIFALSSFVFHAMHFLDKDSEDGSFLKEFKASSTGCIMAVLVTMLPYPYWARDRAFLAAERVGKAVDTTWRECSRLMCSSNRDIYLEDKITVSLKSLKDEIKVMEADIASSWWEVFGRRRAKDRCVLLANLAACHRENYNRIYCVWHNCKDETFGEAHDRLMIHVRPLVEQVGHQASLLLEESTSAVIAGGFKCVGAPDELQFEQRLENTKDAVVRLTETFLQAKLELGLDGVSLELIDEHCFCLNLCAFARNSVQYATVLIEHYRDINVLKPEGCFCCLTHPRDWFLCDREHLSFVIRNFITIMLGMFIGWHGYYYRFRKYDAGIACTSAIILRKYQGSAVAKNLERLQGVVLGTVIGQFVYALLGWCTVWGYTFLLTFCFMWVATTAFVYLHLPEHSSVALLLAVFGMQEMSIGCSDTACNPTNVYYTIANTVTALLLTIIVDMVGRGNSARTMASRKLRKDWKYLQTAVERILDEEETATRTSMDNLDKRIGTLELLGNEARKEVALFTMPWRASAYASALSAFIDLRMFLNCLEFVASQGCIGSPKDPDFLRATQLPSFEPLRNRLLLRFQSLEDELQRFEPKPVAIAEWHQSKVPRMISATMEATEEAELKAFIAEALTVEWEPARQSLELDGDAQVSALLSSIVSMSRILRDLHRTLVHA